MPCHTAFADFTGLAAVSSVWSTDSDFLIRDTLTDWLTVQYTSTTVEEHVSGTVFCSLIETICILKGWVSFKGSRVY